MHFSNPETASSRSEHRNPDRCEGSPKNLSPRSLDPQQHLDGTVLSVETIPEGQNSRPTSKDFEDNDQSGYFSMDKPRGSRLPPNGFRNARHDSIDYTDGALPHVELQPSMEVQTKDIQSSVASNETSAWPQITILSLAHDRIPQ